MTTLNTYTLCISDGSSRDGGGTTAVRTGTLSEARELWTAWAQDGEYADGCHTVRGSIWRGDEHECDMRCRVGGWK